MFKTIEVPARPVGKIQAPRAALALVPPVGTSHRDPQDRAAALARVRHRRGNCAL